MPVIGEMVNIAVIVVHLLLDNECVLKPSKVFMTWKLVAFWLVLLISAAFGGHQCLNLMFICCILSTVCICLN